VSALADTFGDVEQFWSPKRGGYIGGFDMFHTLHCLVCTNSPSKPPVRSISMKSNQSYSLGPPKTGFVPRILSDEPSPKSQNTSM
jgi:hypothetical protein